MGKDLDSGRGLAPKRRTERSRWGEQLFAALVVVGLTAYVVVNLVGGEAAPLPVTSSFLVAFCVSFLLMRRAGRERTSALAERIIQVVPAMGVVAAYLVASAFQGLGAGVRTATIGALLGFCLASAMASGRTS